MGERLTRSELQCVRLAGEGLTDKQIRARLGVASHRTVQSHLASAYRKLGVKDRFAAADAVRRNYAETPIPIPQTDDAGLAERVPADPSPAAQKSVSWPFPAPPKSWVRRLGWVLVFSLVGALITSGVLSIVLGVSEVLGERAPPNAIRTLKNEP